MAENLYTHPEPVPPASQLAVLPFLAAVDGYLREDGNVPGLRITMHRAVSREGDGYLQQVCAYLQESGVNARGTVGRFFPVNDRIIGAAYGSGQIWRTHHYDSVEALHSDLRKTEKGDLSKIPLSYLAIPFLGPQDQVVLILYADCNQLNFFVDEERVTRLVAMSKGLCRLFDSLQKEPFPALRNFPLQKGDPISGEAGLYDIHEPLPTLAAPKFAEVFSFNYEAAVA
ncbi:MAG: hypothetical protein EOQ41_25705 [Mesorhizobium sp.]|uniref:hypothetical protein n=1 Tax=Mesorhizobium sp. TaxID=1871066 RepID=UPI000FE8B756|nr:hypothetical protein [Mesorhizobium sp.]RWB24823.1 MAG: hypothetical protein EOQ41_25705 [Mesorhizobium sp.]